MVCYFNRFFVFEIGNTGFGLALHFSALGLATIGLALVSIFVACLGCGKEDGCVLVQQ